MATVGRLKAKDIREQLKGLVDPALLSTLELLAEQDGVLRHQIMTLANMFNETQDLINKLIGILGVQTNKLDAIEKMKANAIELIEKQELPE